MLGRQRFWLYRTIVAFVTWLGFHTQRVVPVRAPVAGTVAFRPYAEAHPEMPIQGLFEAVSFPPGDARRMRRIDLTARVLSLVTRIPPARTQPIPADPRRDAAITYPWFFRRAWPHAPRVPTGLDDPATDVLADLAVRGPFASYLRRDGDAYVIDVDWLRAHPARPELARPGGRVTFDVVDGSLVTASIEGDRVSLLAGLHEDLTTFRHNISVHLAMLTPFALATSNHLHGAHPVRRLLHHCFHTVLIGNRELGTMQLSGPRSFGATIFSHDAPQLTALADEHLARFDLWDFEPPTQFRARGTTETPFAYPYRDNVLALWAETARYVEEYLERYYDGDDAVSKDSELTSWSAELDRLLPNGSGVPIGGIDARWLARICATLIHVSTVEHDVLNNVVWSYSPFGRLLPTVAPASGEPMDQRRAFDLVATLIGTWKPYNMLLTADIPALALDEQAAAVMRSYLERLARIQSALDRAPDDPSLARPVGFNVSISN